MVETKEALSAWNESHFSTEDASARITQMLRRHLDIARALRDSPFKGWDYATNLEELDNLIAEKIGELAETDPDAADLLHVRGRRRPKPPPRGGEGMGGSHGGATIPNGAPIDLSTIPDLSSAERAALERIGPDGWQRVMDYAAGNSNVNSVGGKIYEELMATSKEFGNALAKAEAAAKKFGFSEPVQVVRDLRGVAPTGTTAGAAAELTDTAFVVVRGDDVYVMSVFESKSPSNLGELARRPSEYLGQIGWDFERLSENPTVIGGKTYQPEHVFVSRRWTDWIGVGPQGEALTAGQLSTIRAGMPGFRYVEGQVSDAAVKRLAARLVDLAR